MNKLISLLALLSLILTISCTNESHLISDPEYRQLVQEQFDKRMPMFEMRDQELLKVFDSELSLEEQQALKFLYAYMPLNDLADYNGAFFLKNIRLAFEARDHFPWGQSISEENFRHFVLPVRSNNENLDNHREIFFAELKERLKGMSMHEAALEINHWCHEKVTYKGTGARTFSPLSVVRNAYGRCGEESVFATQAYRAAGIPCRQVYTPRWAASDDNHAWVEICVDGTWYFAGACEPEPELNMGWFVGPGSRGMIMHARTFGEYLGDEELVDEGGLRAKLNVTENYAVVARTSIRIIDNKGKPLEGMKVGIRLYNYAELYPIVTKTTDEKGECKLKTGIGDVIIWVSNDDGFVFEKHTLSGELIEIVFDPTSFELETMDFDLVPPIENVPRAVRVTDEQREENSRLLKEEDRIRGNYEATFMDEEDARKFAYTLDLNEDEVWKIIKTSRGNWPEIKSFFERVPAERKEYAIAYLNAISRKDLQDTPADILLDHIVYTVDYDPSTHMDRDFYVENIMNPLVGYELLTIYRDFLREELDKLETAPELISWIMDNIDINTTDNVYGVAISPKGTYEMKTADKRSRDIFFVAAARSLGIPARLDQATQIPQYHDGEKWRDALFEPQQEEIPKGTLILENGSKDLGIEPKYYNHFTVARYEDGIYHSLVFEDVDFNSLMKIGDDPVEIEVPEGDYMMITGNRMKDGSVLSRFKFFELEAGGTVNVRVELRKDMQPLKSLGQIDTKKAILSWPENEKLAISDNLDEKGMIISWIDPDREPTKHLMRDINALGSKFESWAGPVLFLIPEEKLTDAFKNSPFPIPDNASYAIGAVPVNQEETIPDLPLVYVVNKQGEIVFKSSGYRIGTGEQLLKILNKME